MPKAWRDRIAGEPVDCINLRNVRSSQIINGTAIVYDAGHTVYVNRAAQGAESLNRCDTLVSKTHGSWLCSIHVVQLYDTSARMLTGLVFSQRVRAVPEGRPS